MCYLNIIKIMQSLQDFVIHLLKGNCDVIDIWHTFNAHIEAFNQYEALKKMLICHDD